MAEQRASCRYPLRCARAIAPGAASPQQHKGDPGGSLSCPALPASTLQTGTVLSAGGSTHVPASLLLAGGCGGNTSRPGVLLGDLGMLSLVGLLFLWKKQALASAGSSELSSHKMHNMCTCSECSFLEYLCCKMRASSSSMNIQLSESSLPGFNHMLSVTFPGTGGKHKSLDFISFFFFFFIFCKNWNGDELRAPQGCQGTQGAVLELCAFSLCMPGVAVSLGSICSANAPGVKSPPGAPAA